MQPFVWNVRVYWEDTDAGGVVYHSRYLNFFERTRTEWLRELGVHQAKMAKEDNTIFVIRNMNIDFVMAARLDDELLVTVHSVQAPGARLVFKQDMIRSSDQQLVVTADVTAVYLKADSLKATRMPAWLRAEIKNAE